jgi:very-short-patch-repair endonuclease
MGIIFLGSQALARGEITRGRLRSSYQALYPDVYMPRIGTPSLYEYTVGAWIWSGCRGVITGRAAAALHGARWVDDRSPIELLWNNNHPPRGIIARNERFTCDEVVEMNDMAVATIQRTAFDLGRHLKLGSAVAHLDALARATGLKLEHVTPLVDLYKGARGVRRLNQALVMMDAGSQSPKETWLRLLLIDAGFPRPQTQIPVEDQYGRQFAFLDMGWEDMMIAVEYDGDQHRTDRAQYAWDVRRLAQLHELGWIHIRVIAEDRPQVVIKRVRHAWAQRETERRAVKRRT